MQYLFVALLLLLLSVGLWKAFRLLFRMEEQRLDTFDHLTTEITILAKATGFNDRARRVISFTNTLKNPDGIYLDMDVELTARVTWYLFAVDVLRMIQPECTQLVQLGHEARTVDQHNYIHFQQKLHGLVRAELDTILNHHQKA